MSKDDKKMGIPKPKYDPKMTKPQHIRSSKKKPFMLMIPEREPTAEELEEARREKENRTWYPDWMNPWRESRINKYATLKAAKTALEAYKHKVNSGSFVWLRYKEMDRAVIMNTNTGEEVI